MSNKKICKNCKHWKNHKVRLFGKEVKSFGKCAILSILGFEALTAWDSSCEGDVNSFEERMNNILDKYKAESEDNNVRD